MAYRKTTKALKNSATCARMRAGKERRRLAGEAPDYPAPLPELRRTIIIIDYDRGVPVEHRIDLHRTRRIDQFRAVVDGREWKASIGFSGVLAGIRKAMPRIHSA